MTESPEFILSKLEPKPGDVIVLKFTRTLTLDTVLRISHMVEARLPPGVKYLIVDGDADVSLLTAEEIQQRVVTDDRSRVRSVSLDSK